jgi:hypothetical protein
MADTFPVLALPSEPGSVLPLELTLQDVSMESSSHSVPMQVDREQKAHRSLVPHVSVCSSPGKGLMTDPYFAVVPTAATSSSSSTSAASGLVRQTSQPPSFVEEAMAASKALLAIPGVDTRMKTHIHTSPTTRSTDGSTSPGGSWGGSTSE